ncbi:MFS transporter [Lacticaseibacillus kribbianus]|uniref:MFS transporter n=1 Tax=Lacticaseibacillus kribbianus TaxID=2926292 RepID=UPI001CD52BDD|nr:MFS transporter [Lacticaseibacillus kribbianus]
MFSILMVIIYVAFISLGLPDSLIGSGWPAMHTALGVPTSYAGILTMMISGNTIISSLLSDRLTRRFGTGLVTATSVLTTAVALFGFSLAPSFAWLVVWTVPYGLGAGAVDAALNNYVALHYKGRQMNWLHCFWGVGASISPYVMSFALTHKMGWTAGYRLIGIAQLVLTVVLFASLPLWQRSTAQAGPAAAKLSFRQLLGLRGLRQQLTTFLAYCSLEATAGIWAATYLAQARGVGISAAARYASLYYLGVMGGRFVAGIIADRLGDRRMIWLGSSLILTSLVLIVLPGLPVTVTLAGLLMLGLGCAPIYPTIIHETPTNFGAANSQAVIGVQMAFAYVGSTFAPPIFGVLAGIVGIGLYPYYILAFTAVMVAAVWWGNRLLPAA